MNEIECDLAGEIVRRIAATGQPVEFGPAPLRHPPTIENLRVSICFDRDGIQSVKILL